MAQYLPLPDGTSVTIREGESPQAAWARAQRMYPEAFAPKPVAAQPAETTVGGNIREFFKGLVPGAIGLVESAATGASALLPEETERRARAGIASLAQAAKAPFAAAPGYEEAVSRKFGEATGSIGPFFALGPFGLAGRAGMAALGTGAGAGEARVRAEEAGATAGERGLSTALGSVVGVSEMFAPLRILGRLDEPLKQGIANRLRRIATAGGEEAAQEASAQIAQNLIAKGVYKPDQAIIEQVGESAAYGGAVGALAQGLLDLALGRRAKGAGTPDEIAQARAEADAAAAAEKERKESPDYAKQFVADYEARRQAFIDARKELKRPGKDATPDVWAAFKEQEKAVKELKESLEKDAKEYNQLAPKVKAEARRAELQPEDVLLQQLGMKVAPVAPPKTRMVIDQFGQVTEVPEGQEAAEPVSAPQQYLMQQVEAARGFGQLSLADYADFAMQNPQMAAEVVKNRIRLPMLTTAENNALLSGINLRLKEAEKQRAAEAKAVYEQRAADLRAQQPTPEIINELQGIDQYLAEIAERGPSQVEPTFEYLDPIFEQAFNQPPTIKISDKVQPIKNASAMRERIEALMLEADQADQDYRTARAARQPDAAVAARRKGTEALQQIEAFSKEGNEYAREFLAARRAQNEALAGLQDVVERLRTGQVLGKETFVDEKGQVQRVPSGKGAAASTEQTLLSQGEKLRAQLITNALQEAALHRRAAGQVQVTQDEAIKAATKLYETVEALLERAKAKPEQAEYEEVIVQPAQMRGTKIVKPAVTERRRVSPKSAELAEQAAAKKKAEAAAAAELQKIEQKLQQVRSDIARLREERAASKSTEAIRRLDALIAEQQNKLGSLSVQQTEAQDKLDEAIKTATAVEPEKSLLGQFRAQVAAVQRQLLEEPEVPATRIAPELKIQFPETEAKKVAEARGETAETVGGQLRRRTEFVRDKMGRMRLSPKTLGKMWLETRNALNKAADVLDTGKASSLVLDAVEPVVDAVIDGRQVTQTDINAINDALRAAEPTAREQQEAGQKQLGLLFEEPGKPARRIELDLGYIRMSPENFANSPRMKPVWAALAKAKRLQASKTAKQQKTQARERTALAKIEKLQEAVDNIKKDTKFFEQDVLQSFSDLEIAKAYVEFPTAGKTPEERALMARVHALAPQLASIESPARRAELYKRTFTDVDDIQITRIKQEHAREVQEYKKKLDEVLNLLAQGTRLDDTDNELVQFMQSTNEGIKNAAANLKKELAVYKTAIEQLRSVFPKAQLTPQQKAILQQTEKVQKQTQRYHAAMSRALDSAKQEMDEALAFFYDPVIEETRAALDKAAETLAKEQAELDKIELRLMQIFANETLADRTEIGTYELFQYEAKTAAIKDLEQQVETARNELLEYQAQRSIEHDGAYAAAQAVLDTRVQTEREKLISLENQLAALSGERVNERPNKYPFASQALEAQLKQQQLELDKAKKEREELDRKAQADKDAAQAALLKQQNKALEKAKDAARERIKDLDEQIKEIDKQLKKTKGGKAVRLTEQQEVSLAQAVNAWAAKKKAPKDLQADKKSLLQTKRLALVKAKEEQEAILQQRPYESGVQVVRDYATGTYKATPLLSQAEKEAQAEADRLENEEKLRQEQLLRDAEKLARTAERDAQITDLQQEFDAIKGPTDANALADIMADENATKAQKVDATIKLDLLTQIRALEAEAVVEREGAPSKPPKPATVPTTAALTRAKPFRTGRAQAKAEKEVEQALRTERGGGIYGAVGAPELDAGLFEDFESRRRYGVDEDSGLLSPERKANYQLAYDGVMWQDLPSKDAVKAQVLKQLSQDFEAFGKAPGPNNLAKVAAALREKYARMVKTSSQPEKFREYLRTLNALDMSKVAAPQVSAVPAARRLTTRPVRSGSVNETPEQTAAALATRYKAQGVATNAEYNGMTFAEAARYGARKTTSPMVRMLFERLAEVFDKAPAAKGGQGRVYAFNGTLTSRSRLARGLFSYMDNAVAITHGSSTTNKTLLHELMHAATFYGLSVNKELDQRVTELRNRVKDWLKTPEGRTYFRQKRMELQAQKPEAIYGLTDNDEFLAELYSDRGFQKLLAQVPSSVPRKNVFTRFIELLSKFFDMPSKAAQSAFADAVALSEEVFQTTVDQVYGSPTPLPTSTRGPLLSVEPTYASPEMEAAAKKLDPFVSKQRGVTERVRAASGGFLGLETMLVDRFAGFERLSKYLPEHLGTQMMYYLRMYDQRMNFVAQAVANGAPSLVTKTRKDGKTERLIEAKQGPSIKRTVEILRDANPMVGNAEAVNRLFTAYMAGIRADNKGFDTLNFGEGVTPEMLKDALSVVENNRPLKKIFDDARSEYNAYNRNLVEFLVETGAISRDVANRLMAENDYIPFYRERGGVAELLIGKEAPIRIGSIKEQPYLQELVGGDQPILDFLTSSVQNTNFLVDMGMRNLATKNAVFELVDLNAAKIVGGKPSGTDVVQFKVDGKDMYAVLATEKVKIGNKEFETGVPADILIKGMAGVPVQMPALLRAFALPAQLLRKGVTLSPLYIARQIFRDSLAAPILAGADFAPVLGALRQIGKPTKDVLERRGITGGQQFTGTSDDLSMILRDVAEGKPGWMSLLAKAESFAMSADALTRRAQYNSYIQQGMSEMEATLMALESMNFSKRGASPSIQIANSMIPFFNAQIQGLNVLYKALTGKMSTNDKLKIRQKLLLRGGMMAAASMVYAIMMQDDEAYKNAEADQKYANWFVRFPGMEEPLRIPIPFEIGYIFKALPEAIVNSMASEEGGKQALKALKQIVIQTIPGGTSMPQIGGIPVPLPIPQALKPAIEAGLGKSFYTGRDILSAREKELLPEEQFRVNTAEISKLIGQTAGVSPIILENLVRGYTGTMGLAFLHALSLGVPPGEGPEKAVKRLSEYPVVGGAFQPNDAGAIVNSMYERMNDALKVERTYEKLVVEGRTAEANALLQRKGQEFMQAELANEFKANMNQITAAERAVQASNMSAEEKRKQLDDLRKLKISIAKEIRDVADKTIRLSFSL